MVRHTKHRWMFWGLTLVVILTGLSVPGAGLAVEPAAPKILIVAGPSTHPPGTHEVKAGAWLMKSCVENATNCQAATAVVCEQWPEDEKVLADISTVVFIGDIFPPERMNDPTKIKSIAPGPP